MVMKNQWQIIKSSPVLVGETKKNTDKFWRCHIVSDGGSFATQTEFWQVTSTGKQSKVQFSTPFVSYPTNVGRANERDSKAQAEFEFDAIIKKQRDHGFRAKGEKKQERPMPMLAHKFKDHKGKVDFPVYVQPKLNGMRMLFDGTTGWSRGNKEVIPEVIQHLQFDTGGHILDGELMLPNNVLLQESMSAIKKYRPGISDKLEYHVYDIVDDTLTFEERSRIIEGFYTKFPKNIVIVTTAECDDEQSVYKYHTGFTKFGYEGTMIRNPKMKYEIGKRSYSLLKLKDFVDAEYRIVAVIDGDGSDSGLAIFVLDAGNGQTFNCRPEGTQENRAELYKNRKKLIGEYLTVRYQELSKDSIPIFPVGVSVRSWGEF
jgi:ATP-dependent DNA ligase